MTKLTSRPRLFKGNIEIKTFQQMVRIELEKNEAKVDWRVKIIKTNLTQH